MPDETIIEELPQNLEKSVEIVLCTGGKSKNICWSIYKGKLRVSGNGDFSDATGNSRAPWRNSRYTINSAEVKVAEMTNASYAKWRYY